MPRRLSHPARKTIGLRVPEHTCLQALLAAHGAPLLATADCPGETEALNDPHDIRERFEHDLAAVMDAGACPWSPPPSSTSPHRQRAATGGHPPGSGQTLAPLGLPERAWQATPTVFPQSETIRRMDFANLIQTVAIYALPVLFAITVHEAARLRRPATLATPPPMLGRISLNPMRHIDPVGTILMPLLLYFATSGRFCFSYAKPVP